MDWDDDLKELLLVRHWLNNNENFSKISLASYFNQLFLNFKKWNFLIYF